MSAQPPTPPPPKPTPIKDALAFLKSAAFRDIAFALILLVVEAILALRYGADTYFKALAEHQAALPLAPSWVHVTLSALDVTLIDGVFVLMLAVAKYAGQSAKASKLRTFAVVAATIMFLVMIGVATDTMLVVIAARWAGGLLLAFVGSDVLLDLAQRFGKWLQGKRANKPAKPFAERLLGASLTFGYVLAVLATVPLSLVVGMVRVFGDYGKAAGLAAPKVVLGKAKPVSIAAPSAEQLPAPTPSKSPTNGKLDAINLQLLDLWRADPFMSNPQAANKVGITGEAVRQRKVRLQASGVIHVNGHGVEIIAPIAELQERGG